MNALELEHVSYTYPDASGPALERVDLRLGLGERVLLEGVSGSGKSTLLRIANGLVPHFYGGRFGGRATVLGMDTRTTSPQSLAVQVGMVFQDLPARFLTDSVGDEIAFSLELAGAGASWSPGQVEAIAERMGVAHLVGRRLEHLSAGEQARLAIAAALARQPKLLLLDEPVTHIDPAGSQAVAGWVRQLSQQEGVTVLLAEHRVETWKGMIDRWVRLGEAGRLEAGRPPLSVETGEPDGLHDQLEGIAPHALRARGVRLSLAHRTILDGVDLDLAPGELLALVGRNGSGKTTLLRSLVGLQRPDAGEIELDGRSLSGLRPSELAGVIGFVPQSPTSLLFADTAEEEIALTLRHRAVGVLPSTGPWLEAFGLGPVRHRYPRDLSAGERQRLALAAILAGRPPVILLDEPTLGMDRRRLSWLGRLLADLRQAGCAILVATHDPGFVAEYATRAVLIQSGQITADGPPEAVLRADAAFSDALDRWRTQAEVVVGEAIPQGDRNAD